ncbi:amidohydrolase [Rhodoblastus acidophilus]|uniref:amidohydrolase n=2 Tax=Rhodoblastus acidophilus TaxID=1074 RepID=UPI0022242D1F|nr:amidohydrolase [Rhodoblastus acidophilus]MCW2286789.1 putative amidohydrolase YtcJ [Rhodoblastus acidophilus]
MCVMCNPAFAEAFRTFTFPSRRQMLKAAAAGAFVCEAADSAPALAQEGSLQDVASRFAPNTFPRVTIFRAKDIVTLDPDKPSATAVAVLGDRILAVGSVEELQAAAGGQPYVVDETFADKVIVPGLIAQHDHPLLTGLTMVSEIIAIEDWALPSGVVPAAKSPQAYRERLMQAHAKLRDPGELLVTWGYHQLFHGPLTRADLDRISTVRPIVVWHRSAHEFILNSKALKAYGIDAAFVAALPEAARNQSNLDAGHFWEGGMFAVIPKLLPALATPERLRRGLEFVTRYFHANGVTLGCEPGGLFSKQLQDAQNAVLSRPDSPFRFYFIPDGKSISAAFPDSTISETQNVLGWGEGMTAMMPGAIKLFADGAIYSLLMQVREPYLDGHHGEWIMEPDFFARAFKVYWEADYQIHVHVNGDAGLDMVLDNVEANLRRHPRYDHRTVAIHLAVSRKDQVERIRRLGVIVSGNPYYVGALADAYGAQGLGRERADAMVRLGDVERAGVSFSLHSDMPMAPGQPLFLMHCAVNRTTASGRVAAPEQRVSRLGALKGVTLDAAHSLRLENEIGSIVPGKLANLTILGDNPLTVDAAGIKDIAVWGTVQEGRVLPVK